MKGELLDLKGINDAINGRDYIMKLQSACMSKKRSDESELDKLMMGKTTMKSFFKTKSSKENDIIQLQGLIEMATKDIKEFDNLIKFLTIYHGEIAIEKFKS